MRHKSSQVESARRGLRWLAVVAALWLLLLFVMIGWWGWVVYTQAQKIAELQTLAGLNTSEAHADWVTTQRMLMWEGGAYFVLLAGVSGALIWLYWRDRRRTNALQAFLASVTHELKTPLTSIRLQAESLAETSQARALIERLLEDTSRLEAQVEKMLELARLEGGGALALQPLPIVSWLQRFRRSGSVNSKVEIGIEEPANGDSPLVLADPSALQIIFRNLVENTARHSQSSAAQARVRFDRGAQDVCVTFADDGVGFSGERRHLGMLFFRGARSQGAGVGLYLVQSLMQLMGGRAEFNVGSGRGFETRLHFRRAEDAP
jgi:signal transduction histidine kinase